MSPPEGPPRTVQGGLCHLLSITILPSQDFVTTLFELVQFRALLQPCKSSRNNGTRFLERIHRDEHSTQQHGATIRTRCIEQLTPEPKHFVGDLVLLFLL